MRNGSTQQQCRADIAYKLVVGIAILMLMYMLTGDTPITYTLIDDKVMEDVPLGQPSDGDAGAELPFQNQTRTHLLVHERHKLSFKMTGSTFDETGKCETLNSQVTSYLIHSFSPYIEREAMRSFLDPPRENVYFANSPAIIFYQGDLVLISRIWLDKEKYKANNDWPANNFADNWFYTQRFDNYLKPVTPGAIMGIPTGRGGNIGDGPIEPRVFNVAGKLFVTFNTAMTFRAPDTNKKFTADYTVMWDMDEQAVIIPMLQGGSAVLAALANHSMPRDKHWMALVQDEELYFVQILDPLKIMHCTLDGFCKMVHQGNNNGHPFVFKDSTSHLRGGTPFLLYQWPYYISVAHSTLFKDPRSKRFYTAHLVVLAVNPYRVVYVSADIRLHEAIYAVPMVRSMFIDDGFFFPVGLIIEDQDTLVIGGHINDHSSVLVRLRGVKSLMEQVIKADTVRSPTGGPPVGTLHKYIHDVMENGTNYRFHHTELKT